MLIGCFILTHPFGLIHYGGWGGEGGTPMQKGSGCMSKSLEQTPKILLCRCGFKLLFFLPLRGTNILKRHYSN